MTRTSFVICLLACVAPLAFSWPYGEQVVKGVNLGGWLLLEKWMVPQVFEGLPSHINDEYALTQYLGYQEAERRLRAHWDSWVTEADIIQLKNAGINHVRIPLGYWAFDIKQGEPWVRGSWDYAVKAAEWCRTHGIQVMMDLHGAPGSQNGNDHSGQSGAINFYYNDENLQRSTNVLREIARWANASEWRNTVSIIQLLNEPVLWDDYNYRLDRLKQFYRMAYDAVRAENDIAVIAVHDAFIGLDNWYYLRDDPHYWWVMLDTHIYQVFGDEWGRMTCQEHEVAVCRQRQRLREANNKLWTVIGEWSLATPAELRCTNQAALARNQIGIWEEVSGWFFWSHNNGQGWAEWSMKHSLANGWIRPNENNRPNC